MDADQFRRLEADFNAFLDRFSDCFSRKDAPTIWVGMCVGSSLIYPRRASSIWVSLAKTFTAFWTASCTCRRAGTTIANAAVRQVSPTPRLPAQVADRLGTVRPSGVQWSSFRVADLRRGLRLEAGVHSRVVQP